MSHSLAMWIDQQRGKDVLPGAILADLESWPDAKMKAVRQKCPSTSICFFRQRNRKNCFISVYWCTEDRRCELRDDMKSNGFEEALVPFNLGLLRSKDYSLHFERWGDRSRWLPFTSQAESHLIGNLSYEDLLEHKFLRIGDIPARVVNKEPDSLDQIQLHLKPEEEGSRSIIIQCRGIAMSHICSTLSI